MDNQNIEQYKFIELNGIKLFVMRNGLIYRFFRNHHWKIVANENNTRKGYNRFGSSKRKMFRHRIMCYAFKQLDINNKELQVDHIDGDRLNNHIDNLRIVSNQENQWNRKQTKGYSWNKKQQKWIAKICVNYKHIHLGLHTTEEDARQAYIQAKLKFHLIHN